jgi:hypothetical protein
MLKKGLPKKIILLLSLLILTPMVIANIDAFALGPPPLHLGSTVMPVTQEINAGGVMVYYVTMNRFDFFGWFNVTVGLRATREQFVEQKMLVAPFPEGVEAIYPRQIYLDREHLGSSFPVVIKTPADMPQTEMWISIIISGIDKSRGELQSQTYYGNNDVKLIVAPLETPLGVASPLLFEGFNQNLPPDWTFNQVGGNVRVMGDNFPNHFTFLELDDTWPARHVEAERSIPRLNDASFIAEFKLRSETPNHFQMMFELTTTTSSSSSSRTTNSSAVISAGFSDGKIQVQNKSYSQYIVDSWYLFRVEVEAKQHIFKWYLDGKYMDALAWSGSPIDGIRLKTTDSEIGTADVAEIFIQKIIVPASSLKTMLTTTVISTQTVTVTSYNNSTTTRTITTSAATPNLSITTSTPTTISTTVTSTSTAISTERVTEPSIYAWAAGATVLAVVLAIFTLRRKS